MVNNSTMDYQQYGGGENDVANYDATFYILEIY